MAAALLGVMGLIPGMPNVAFLLGAAALGSAAWVLHRRALAAAAAPPPAAPAQAVPTAEQRELSWEDVHPVDLIGLEVGYRLCPLVDTNHGGELLARIRGVRRKLTQELGFLVPAVHIRDNLELAPHRYRVLLSGVPVGEGVIYPDRDLAINPGRGLRQAAGHRDARPGVRHGGGGSRPAEREHAQTLGYTVVDASTVVATHSSHLVQTHAHELLGHEEVQQLLNGAGEERAAARRGPGAEGAAARASSCACCRVCSPSACRSATCARSSRRWPRMRARTQEPAVLQAQVRVALGRQIVQDIAGLGGELPVITLEPDLEQLLQSSLNGAGTRAWRRASPSGCRGASPTRRSARRRRASPPCCWWRRHCARRWPVLRVEPSWPARPCVERDSRMRHGAHDIALMSPSMEQQHFGAQDSSRYSARCW